MKWFLRCCCHKPKPVVHANPLDWGAIPLARGNGATLNSKPNQKGFQFALVSIQTYICQNFEFSHLFSPDYAALSPSSWQSESSLFREAKADDRSVFSFRFFSFTGHINRRVSRGRHWYGFGWRSTNGFWGRGNSQRSSCLRGGLRCWAGKLLLTVFWGWWCDIAGLYLHITYNLWDLETCIQVITTMDENIQLAVSDTHQIIQLVIKFITRFLT